MNEPKIQNFANNSDRRVYYLEMEEVIHCIYQSSVYN